MTNINHDNNSSKMHNADKKKGDFYLFNKKKETYNRSKETMPKKETYDGSKKYDSEENAGTELERFFKDWSRFQNDKRSPEAQVFWKTFDQTLKPWTVWLNDKGYPTKYIFSNGIIYLQTAITDVVVPHDETLLGIEITPNIKNLRYMYWHVNVELAENNEKIQQRYLKYLRDINHKGWKDEKQWYDFYGHENDEKTREYFRNYTINNAPAKTKSALDRFVQYVVPLGADESTAKKSPRTAYRQLALKYHPDVNKEADPAIFVKLNNLFNALPENLKKASRNWYGRMRKKI